MMLTPNDNQRLPRNLGEFASLCAGLDYAAQGETGFNFFSSRGRLEQTLPFTQLRCHAIHLATKLAARGYSRLDRVALVADTSAEFVTLFFACQYAGLVPVPLPLCINFGGKDDYQVRLRGMIEAANASLAMASENLIDNLHAATSDNSDIEVLSCTELEQCPSSVAEEALEPLDHSDPCYIQYSSGSTSFPRGVLVTQRALTANARSIGQDGMQLQAGDRCCSWLPLYHDMGLVGCCLTPVLNQVSVDFIATTTFAKRPLLWLDLISRNRSTISFGPTFGYELCARRASKAIPQDLDLSCWRVAGIGGEMIRPRALRSFVDIFRGSGFDADAYLPSYGMAETTLAVTFTKLGKGVQSDRILRRDAYEDGIAVQATEATDSILMPSREFALCGKPMPGYRIEIRDCEGNRCGERVIGRIFIQGPSLMEGYFQEPTLSAKVLSDDGWLNSGDLGYLIDGNLVVTGRSKDLIIIGGRNIWPQDLEWAIESHDSVRSGDCAAFSMATNDDREQVVIVTECRQKNQTERAELRRELRAIVQKIAGVESQVVLAAPKSLAFTTSGKLSRAAVKSAYEQGEIADLDLDASVVEAA